MFFVVLNVEEKSEEMTKEEKNLALMAMKKKDKRLYDRIMHSKKKKRSEVRQARSRKILTKLQLASYLSCVNRLRRSVFGSRFLLELLRGNIYYVTPNEYLSSIFVSLLLVYSPATV